MIKKVTTLIVIACILQTVCFAQTRFQIRVDSLLGVVNGIVPDTVKVIALTALTFEFRNNNPDTSIYFANKALSIAKKINFKLGIADAHLWKAWPLYTLGRTALAIRESNEALNMYDELLVGVDEKGKRKLFSQKAKVFNNLGLIYWKQGNFPEAINNHFLSLKINEEYNNPRGVAVSYQNIAMIHSYTKNNDEAIKNFNASLAIKQKSGDSLGVANVLLGLGIVYHNVGKYAEEIKSQQDALALFKIVDEGNECAGCYTNMGNAYRELGNYEEALKNHREALRIHTKEKSKDGIAIANNNIGSVFLEQKKYSESEIYFNNCVDISKEIGNNFNIREAYSGLSIAAFEKKEFEKSLEYYKLHIAFRDSVFNKESDGKIAEIKTKYETEKKDNEIILLNKEKDVQKLSLAQQQAALLLSQLESEKNNSEIELLNKTKDIQELKLTKTQQDLLAQLLTTKAQTVQLALEKKDKVLQEQQLSKEKLYRNILIVGSLALALVGFLLFNRYTLNKKIEHQAVLISQRKHISADLHDDVGSTLSSISIYSEAIKNKLNQNEPEKVMALVNKIGDNARETISNLSDIVWSINPINDSGEKVFARMESFASSVLASKDVALHFKSDATLNMFDYKMEAKQNLFLIFKEAINNTAKYADAKNVQVTLAQQNHQLILEINDDGKGFSVNEKSNGNGLKNMNQRTKELGGAILITSNSNGTKTVVTLSIAQIAVA